jgi:fibronectin type 3 domain-containing protein
MERKTGKGALSTILITLMLCGAFFIITADDVEATQSGDYTFTVVGGFATVTGYTGAGGAISIPATLGGYTTVAIGDGAFASCTSLTSVTIPNSVLTIGVSAFEACTAMTTVTIGNSVTTIGDGAFSSCIALTSVTIPSSVTTIGDGAFIYCLALTSVTIPSSVTTIGSMAFGLCTSLTSINVASLNPNYASSVGVLYNKALTTLIHCPAGKSGAFTIPNGVLTIGTGAFYFCRLLTSVNIPSTVTTIGNGAFYNCSLLTTITIPSSVTTIGENPMLACSSLTSIDVNALNPNYASSAGVLYNKLFTTLIECPGGKSGAFTIPDTVTTISPGAFYLCTSLTSITIPVSVTTIGNSAFIACTALTSITIPSSVTTIAYSTFESCTSLTSVTMTNSITSIGNNAFESCTSLTSFTIGSSVTSIGIYTFISCTSLRSIDVDAMNLNFASVDGALYNNAMTTLLQCPGGKTGAFTVPSSIATIGAGAFWGCSSLVSIAIPSSVSTIMTDAFHYCGSLTAINVASGNPTYASVDGALYNKALTTLVRCPGGKVGFSVPDSVSTIGHMAFYTCSSLTAVTIGRNVASIESDVFTRCTSLMSITFLGPVAPVNVDAQWNQNAPSGLRGHAYAASNFPVPGRTFNGLIMGSVVPVVPGIPTGLSATSGNSQVFLAWTAPVNDGGSAVTNYMVYRSTISTGIYTQIASPTGLNYTDTEVVNDQTYWYKLSAVNSAGEGTMTENISSTPHYVVPDAPEGLTITPGNTQVTLNWLAPNDDGGSDITGYKVYRSAAETGVYVLIASPTALTYIDTGLTNGQTYWYNVSAVNAAGEGAKTAIVSSSPRYDLPDAPDGLTATPGNVQVVLNWTAPVNDGGTPVTGYKVYRSTTMDGTYTLIASPSGTIYTNTGLNNGQTYWYKVSAVNAQGEGPITAAISSTPATVPTTQQDLQSTPGTGQVTLTWQPLVGDGGSPITGYRLYRSTTSDGTYSLLASVSGLTYVDTGLAGGQTYWYKVSAINAIGEGAQGPAFSAQVPQTASSDNTIPLVIAIIAIAIALVAVVLVLLKGKR